ncbi:MAG TPA: ATP-dependent DNA helicase [Methyloprofundus sp.]|uniref:ATP-dependent DNA helicase n=1 Tax=Methyloprofundus sp. TaxID=2020875 RepID=UPI001855202D|nr:ATP-dependent DNA helicase [Methyloprofundus sp.]HIG64309.1 ATP-dependent DNA helicase [Methyloprofundus sp.]HIL78800.1 ATP-dependent DNA helicase [Methylococcales bacterium]
MDNQNQIEEFFAADGKLAKVIPGYLPREAQVEMAEAIAQSIENKEHVIVEAGTGTGKTFAYLVPAILSGKKVIVSTGTKNLQDQLFNKDVPLIRDAMTVPFSAALLKGRANYLCTYRLELAVHSNLGFSREEAADLASIKKWSKSTRTGDIADMSDVMESNPVWSQATSTRENCIGQDCPEYTECFLMKARKKAQDAHLIVVNHHLLCADWSIRETGFGELLPNADVVIIDEAHQLADTASNFLGMSLGSKQLSDLAKDALMEYFQDASDMPDLRVASENLEHEVKDMRLAFGMNMTRGDWHDIEGNPKVNDGLLRLQEHLDALADQLELASVRSKGLESCFKRAEELEQQFKNILQDNSGKWVRWYETHKKSFTLSLTPLDIAAEFKTFMAQHSATWIFTSATLSVAHKFDHFANSLGISNPKSYSWESPFDFPNQSLFYHPKGLPQPNAPDFVDEIVKVAIPVINASQGRTFFLFTSHRALQAAAKILDKKIKYPILVQGDKPKAILLDDFKQKGNAVLLGTASFWEGIDVRGEALSTVIIDKLPFSSPGDPVLKARLEAMEKQGRKPFVEYQLPTAVIALRQGIGRLIRDVNDRGVLLLCDPRLLKKSYGHMFLNSVPAMRRTRDIKDVEGFFAEEEK